MLLRHNLTYGTLAVLFAGIGVLQLAAPYNSVMLENGSLPTITSIESQATEHLSGKTDGNPLDLK